ncbi:MAG TPA: hypothetical protein VLA51_03375 [Paracoccaceae bacterium]|nr:hypothetical protein [Paracoccaceae bacterium]
MTALEKYARLESVGFWREKPDAKEVEVVVSFGDATLVLSDFAENLLAHWALPAVQKIAESDGETIFSPDGEGHETLRISDAEMLTAIKLVSRAGSFPKPPSKLSRWIVPTLLAVGAVAFALWAPDQIRAQAVEISKGPAAQLLSDKMLAAAKDQVGAPCKDPRGLAANDIVLRRLFRTDPPKVVILPNAPRPMRLPGGVLLVDRATLQSLPNAEAFAGLLAYLHASHSERVLTQTIKGASLSELLQYLGKGVMPETALRAGFENLLQDPPNWILPNGRFGELMNEANLPTTPVAEAVAAKGAPVALVRALLQSNSVDERGYLPVLRDQDWVALREICIR